MNGWMSEVGAGPQGPAGPQVGVGAAGDVLIEHSRGRVQRETHTHTSFLKNLNRGRLSASLEMVA